MSNNATYSVDLSKTPTTISANVADGVYGGGTTDWVVTNDATITAGTATGAYTATTAVYLVKGTLTNAGVIGDTATKGGVVHLGTGSVINTGFIDSPTTQAGVVIETKGTVTNSVGTISGVLVGVDLGFSPGDSTAKGGGGVTNNAKASIIGDDGVLTYGAAATVTNAGTITGATATTTIVDNGSITLTLGFGVALQAGGTVTNKATGTITGATDGVYLTDGGKVTNAKGGKITGGATGVGVQAITDSATVTNSGVIGGAITSVGVDLGYDPITSTFGDGGTVTNNAGATISGYDGVLMSGGTVTTTGTVTNFASTVTNFGTISGTKAVGVLPGIFGVGVLLLDDGNVSNNAGGTITGVFEGVDLTQGGAVTNAAGATISAKGVNVTAVASSQGSATLTNHGTIAATGAGRTKAVSLFGGGSEDTGAASAAVIAVTNTGGIAAAYQGVAIGGARTETVTNSGTIKASYGIGVSVSGLEEFNGAEFNSGGTGTNSVSAYMFSVTNEKGGVITGGSVGVEMGAGDSNGGTTAASVTNGGSIKATSGPGLRLNAYTVSVTNSGSIAASYCGLDIEVESSSTVTNTGSIKASYGAGVRITDASENASPAVLAVDNNAGSITAAADGVENIVYYGNATVTNAAAITSTGGTGVSVDAWAYVSSGSGSYVGGAATVSNTGSIAAAQYGVQMDAESSATVTNGGKIKSTDGTGISVNMQSRSTVNAAVAVTNSVTGSITAAYNGVEINGEALTATVTNAGSIKATTGNGIYLWNSSGASAVTNKIGGSVSGAYDGLDIVNSNSATVTNGGAITAANGSGVDIIRNSSSYDLVTNLKGGVITGADDGVSISDGASAVVTNAGSITGKYGAGVYLATNTSTLTNSGTISGATASVEFSGAGENILILQTGSTLIGAAIGSTSADGNTLELEGTGTANNVFENFGTLTVDPGAAWTLSAAATIGQTTVDGGSLTAKAALTTAFDITDDGLVTLDVASNDSVTFGVTNSGALVLGKAVNAVSGFEGTVSGFSSGDGIVFRAATYSPKDTVSVSTNGEVVTIDNAKGTAVATFNVDAAGDYAPANFTLGAAAGGGLEVGYSYGPDDPGGNVNVAQYLAEKTALDQDPNGFTINDTAADLKTLTAAELKGAVATGMVVLYDIDTGNVSFTAAQTAAFAADGFMAAVVDAPTDVDLLSNNLTLSSSSGELYLAGTRGADDIETFSSTPTIDAAGRSGETFSFVSGFGLSTIAGFLVSAPTGTKETADALDLDTTMFAGMTSTGSATAAANAADVQSLINGKQLSFYGTTASLRDTAGDMLTLTGISSATAFEKDIKFFTQ